MKMRILTGYAVAATLVAMFAVPAFAQSVNPHAEQQLQNWIAKDPRLQSDPGLMNDPAYLKNHPNFATWLSQHPNAHRQVEQMGAYDNGHHWRDTNWWHQNDPNWVSQHHPEWAGDHPEWHSNYGSGQVDGDWDDQHHWHDRDWWNHNRADWVKEHHPEWAERHEKRVEHREAVVKQYEKHHDQHDHDHAQDPAHH